jgi:hypothetical protein
MQTENSLMKTRPLYTHNTCVEIQSVFPDLDMDTMVVQGVEY